MPPAYDFETFIAACQAGAGVKVGFDAQQDASTHFGLHTQRGVLSFVGDGGLETPKHANNVPWKNNPDKSVEIRVDSYDFYSGTTHGYIAFLYNPKTKLWFIKSFKPNDKPGQRFTQMGDALRKFLGSTEK